MRAPACLVGKHDAHLVHHGFVFWVGGSHEAGKVVGVGQPNAAFAAGNCFDLIGVAALGRARHVVCHAFEPSLGSGRADMLADGAKQAQVVGMRAAAGAQLAFVFGLAQLFIGVHIVALDTGFVVNHHARTGGKAKPCRAFCAGFGAVLLGNGFVQKLGFDGCKQAIDLAFPQASRINQQNHICRGRGAFCAQTIQNPRIVCVHAVDLDARGFGEIVVKRLVRAVVAGRIQVQRLVILRLRRHSGERSEGDGGKESGFQHGEIFQMTVKCKI